MVLSSLRQCVVLWIAIVDDIFGSILEGSAGVADFDFTCGLTLDIVGVALGAGLYAYSIFENFVRVLSGLDDAADVKFWVFAVAWRESTNVLITVYGRD